jgi:hypothetical protein
MKPKPTLGSEGYIYRNKSNHEARKQDNCHAGKERNHKTRKRRNQKRIKVAFHIPEGLFIQMRIKAAKGRKKIGYTGKTSYAMLV